MKYPNFYENLPEANMRLKSTIVMYAGEPVFIWCITDHKGDGKFRVYFSSPQDVGKCPHIQPLQTVPHDHPQLGPLMDTYIQNSPITIQRKQMVSKHFNEFRPFPLGMMNINGGAHYVARRPNRPKVEQGLQANMLEQTTLSAGAKLKTPNGVAVFSPEFRDCIVGDYPTPKECLQGLKEDNVNESVAFHRNFALVRGPIDTLFLGYKDSVVGVLPRNDFSTLRLGRHFKHVKEAANELRLFTTVE